MLFAIAAANAACALFNFHLALVNWRLGRPDRARIGVILAVLCTFVGSFAWGLAMGEP